MPPAAPRLRLAIAAALLLLTAAPARAGAPIGAVDPGFGSDGRVVWTRSASPPHDLAVLPDGSVLVLLDGLTDDPDGTPATRLLRYLPDGTPDPAFGVNGSVDVAADGMVFDEMTVAPSGKILLAGWTLPGTEGAGDMALMRLRLDGTPDPLFDGDGLVTVDGGLGDQACSVAVQADGKILLAGERFVEGPDPDSHSDDAFDVSVVRLWPSGGVNTAFGRQGVETLPVEGRACDVVPNADGTIVVGGVAGRFGCPVIRLTATGAPDPTWDGDGIGVYPGAETASLVTRCEVAVDGAGGVLLATRGMRVRRIRPNGQTDASFGDGGVASIDFFDSDTYTGDVVIDADGDIVVAGSAAGLRRGDDMALARLSPTGVPDASFGAGGVLVTDASRGGAGEQLDDRIDHVAVVSSNSLLALGAVTVHAGERPAMLRFGPLSLDTVPPLSTIERPEAGATYGQLGLLALRGTAADLNSEVVRVDVALRRTTKDGNCTWLGHHGGWVLRACNASIWHVADGTVFWSFELHHQLLESASTNVVKYRAYARAVDRAGNVEHVFASGRNSNAFEIRN
jgi:uncharacterized delta-60 repeat protein